MSWNVFMNTCASTGDDDAVISHPFKPYTRERFPGAVLPPPTTAEQRAAAEAPATAQPEPQPQLQPQLPGGYVPAPQSVGSHVLIATAPSSSTSLSGHVMPQQLQLYQQQLYATAHNAPPGMYYQAPDEAGPADTDPTYYPQYQQQQQQQQHYPQYAYPYPYQQPAQMQQAMMTPAAPFVNPYAQAAYAPGAYMYPTPYQYPYYPTQQQPMATAVPTATAAEMPDPHRPTYAQNIIGQEVAKRERIAALLSTRINNG